MPTAARRPNAVCQRARIVSQVLTPRRPRSRATVVDPKEADKERKSMIGTEQAPTLAEQTPDQNTWQASATPSDRRST
jgi:hypothetical protein